MALSLFSKRSVNSYNSLFSCILATDLKLSVILNAHGKQNVDKSKLADSINMNSFAPSRDATLCALKQN